MTIITPLCVMILLKLLQLLAEFQHGKEVNHPDSYPLSGIEDCQVIFLVNTINDIFKINI